MLLNALVFFLLAAFLILMTIEKYNVTGDFLEPTPTMKLIALIILYLFKLAELEYACMIIIVGMQLAAKKEEISKEKRRELNRLT